MDNKEKLISSEGEKIVYKNTKIKKKYLCINEKVSWEEMPNRKIISQKYDPLLPNNKIETSKYNFLTFIPKNLIEQFSKMANLYFLIIGFLSMITEISTSGGQPVIFLPLTVIVIITAIKDAFEDLKRKISDSEENNRKITICKNRGLEKVRWENLQVGDIIKVSENEYFPADVLLLSSSESKGAFSKSVDSEKCGVDANCFILRGCSLRNTKYIYGMVAYTGHDTKIMLNSVPARAKTSHMVSLMNSQIIIIFIVQIAICLFAGFFAAIWYEINRDNVHYLGIGKNDIKDNNFAYNFFVRFGNWLMMFMNFVPISLLVTLEMVKFLQGYLISKDPNLISKETNTPTVVQTSSLNEELGQIDYIFSDKTGTLTCNLMEFKMLNVFGCSYGDDRQLEKEELAKKKVVTNVDFKDRNFFRDLENPESEYYDKICDTLLHLALCHTIITEEKNGEITYNASSPDELALVNLARFSGCEFAGCDDDNNLLVNFQGKTLKYKLLNVLEFNSTRKRMSVIVRDPDNKILLLTKGADTILEPKIKKTEDVVFQKTRNYLVEYASIGLRTLLLAKKYIEEDEYNAWNARFKEAASSLENKEKKIDAVEEEIEVNMELVGATAIEDKLQDEVGNTISLLKRAGIKIWVLTGDKVETAINIGYSCQLLDDSLGKIIIDGTSDEQVVESIQTAFKRIQQAKKKEL